MIFVYLCIALYIIVTAWCFLDIIKDGENMVDNDNIPADAYKNYGRAFVIPDCKPMTNADRIRAMTDEELACYIGHLVKQGRRQVVFDYECGLNWLKDECDKWFFEWLKQEATNELG